MADQTRYYTVDNKKYVSVTSVTSQIAKPALYRFYAKHGWEGATQISSQAKDTGSKLHEFIKNYLGPETTDLSNIEAHLPVEVRNFLNFVEVFKPKPLLLEAQLVNAKYKYAGTVDAVVRVKETVVLIDWKTSSAVYDEYLLQVEAYYRALMYEAGISGNEFIHPQELWVVRFDKIKEQDFAKSFTKLQKEGSMVRTKPNAKRWKAFRGLLNLFYWGQGKHK